MLTTHQGVLNSYISALLPGDAEVPDILQKTNLVLWEKREEFDPEQNFKGWALSIAYWEARSWMTARKRKAWLIYDEEVVRTITNRFTSNADTHGYHAPDTLNALRLCMTKLKDSDRLVVVNHYQHEKSLRECGEILGRSRDSLKVSLFRIRSVLRRYIKSHLAVRRHMEG